MINPPTQSFVVSASEPNFSYGVYIAHPADKTVRQTLEEGVHFNPPSVYPIINLAIQMPCGEGVFSQKLDDIPEVDTPCTCGNPNHYFVKIGVI